MFDFDTLVDRRNIGNMKNNLLPDSLRSREVIGFAGAEMDFRTAPVVVDALKNLASRGLYGYTLPDENYLQAVVWWMKSARNLAVEQDEIVPTLGTMFSLGTAIRAFTKPDDGIIVQHPGYSRYEARIQSNSRRVVSSPLVLQNGTYLIDFSELEHLMAQSENKVFVLCNPHNPTGKVFSRGDLEKIAELAERYAVLVFSDEIFGEITYGSHVAVPFVEIYPERTILCTSLGKVFNFTGVNHANVIIKNKVLRADFICQRFADHFGSIDPFFYTALVAGYSPEGLAWVTAMRKYVWDNYIYAKDYFNENLPRLQISPLEGSFIIWINFRNLGLPVSEITGFLEEKALLLADDGKEYGPGGEGFIRMNIAVPRKNLISALNNLHAAYKEEGF